MKKRYYVLITIFLLIAFCVVWNIYDNQRFVVTEQTVTLDDLPNSFDGYRILQISDLHGKYFGENQLDLLSAINQLDYDCILFTGDMNKYEESDLLSSQAIFDLINGIEKKEMAFWTFCHRHDKWKLYRQFNKNRKRDRRKWSECLTFSR